MIVFQSPGPILAEFGPITLRWYGLMYAIAFISSLYIADKYLRPKEILEDELNQFAINFLISGLIGARLWFVFLEWQYFINHLNEIPQIWLGGQSIQGGMLGAWLGTYLLELNKSQYLNKLAILITIAPLAQAIGRWGNFFNEEAFGSPTNLPWGLYISHTGTYHHPTFLYEAIWNLICFVILFNLYRSQKNQPLLIIGLYLCLYSLGRFFIEMIRADSLMFLGYPAASLMAIIGFIVGLVLIKINNENKIS